MRLTSGKALKAEAVNTVATAGHEEGEIHRTVEHQQGAPGDVGRFRMRDQDRLYLKADSAKQDKGAADQGVSRVMGCCIHELPPV